MLMPVVAPIVWRLLRLLSAAAGGLDPASMHRVDGAIDLIEF